MIQDVEIDRKGIGKRLERLREESNLSQTQLGVETGYSRGQIWQFERGIGLTLENLSKLSAFFKKPLDFFIGGEAVNERN